jgi:squalene synthase HpnC
VSSAAEIEAADRYCRSLAGRHYENFSVASAILPAETRAHLARIYAFCRTTDDLGDESGKDGLGRLQVWREQVLALFGEGVEPIHPVLVALERSVQECRLPATPFLALIDANVQDQTVATYETWDALLDYCTRSAAPVGRMVLGVFGLQDARAVALSDDVCIGLQLANFAQDVSVDRGKGRTYLVQADIRDAGVKGAVRRVCDRAESLLGSGRELETMAPFRLRIQLALYRLGGCAIVAAVRDLDYGTDSVRPHLSAGEKFRLVPRALGEAIRRRTHVPAHNLA